MSWIALLAGVGSAIANAFAWLTGWSQRRAGRIEGERDALRREADQLNRRGRIEDDVRAATRDGLEDELRGGRK